MLFSSSKMVERVKGQCYKHFILHSESIVLETIHNTFFRYFIFTISSGRCVRVPSVTDTLNTHQSDFNDPFPGVVCRS